MNIFLSIVIIHFCDKEESKSKDLFALNVGGSIHIGIVENRIWKALQRNTSICRSLEYFNANVIFLATSKIKRLLVI